VTKCVGKKRDNTTSPPLPPGPKNTSTIQTSRIVTAPLTGLLIATPMSAPIAM
jgi:hypothetical protein